MWKEDPVLRVRVRLERLGPVLTTCFAVPKGRLMATPFAGQAFMFRNRDGTEVPVLGWGSQFGAVFAGAGLAPSHSAPMGMR
jgi:hypothetical protein